MFCAVCEELTPFLVPPPGPVGALLGHGAPPLTPVHVGVVVLPDEGGGVFQTCLSEKYD